MIALLLLLPHGAVEVGGEERQRGLGAVRGHLWRWCVRIMRIVRPWEPNEWTTHHAHNAYNTRRYDGSTAQTGKTSKASVRMCVPRGPRRGRWRR